MPAYLALLRGINLGGRNKVAMADLRKLAESLGHADVATYIQSGNLIFSNPGNDPAALADALEREIESRLGVRAPVVVLSRAGLAAAVAANPFSAEPDPRRVHLVFRNAEPGPDAVARIEDLLRKSRESGSRDDIVRIGATLYLHTPDGYGRSDLAAQLFRASAKLDGTGTARNWATVTKLLSMLEAAGQATR